YVAFTGSTATGRLVAQRAAARLIGCSLELGGKNPMLVLADADVERAAEGAVRACFASAGQLCVAIERLTWPSRCGRRSARRSSAGSSSCGWRPSFGYDADMGSLTSARQLEHVSRHLADAVAKGATVLTGGRARPGPGAVLLRAHRAHRRHRA